MTKMEVKKKTPSPGRAKKRAPPAIVVDVREKHPYFFKDTPTIRRWIPTGDYTLDGFDERIAIERKSPEDAYGSVGQSRDRFEREWGRLSQLEYAAVVIEATPESLYTDPPPYSSMHPNSVISTYLAWSIKYGVPVYFAGNRGYGAAMTRRLLHYWWKYKVEGA